MAGARHCLAIHGLREHPRSKGEHEARSLPRDLSPTSTEVLLKRSCLVPPNLSLLCFTLLMHYDGLCRARSAARPCDGWKERWQDTGAVGTAMHGQMDVDGLSSAVRC
jgi:hypothetical protein